MIAQYFEAFDHALDTQGTKSALLDWVEGCLTASRVACISLDLQITGLSLTCLPTRFSCEVAHLLDRLHACMVVFEARAQP